MSETTTFLIALLQLLPALAWGMVARGAWRFRVSQDGHKLALLVALAACLGGYFLIQAGFTLVPQGLHDAPPIWLIAGYVLGDVLIYQTLAVFRHLARVLRDPNLIRRGWLVCNYGLAAAMSAFAVVGPSVLPFDRMDERLRVYSGGMTLYSIVLTALGARDMAYASRPGRGLRSGAGVTITRRADVAFLAGVVVLLLAMVALHVTGSWREHPVALRATVTAMGLLLVAPIASRNLGEMLRGLVTTTAMIAAVAGVYFGMEVLLVPHVDAGSRMRVRMLAVLALVLLLGPAQRAFRELLGALLFGRGRRQAEALLEYLQRLDPGAGVQACCEAAVDGLVRVGGARGAAIVLRGGVGAAAGSIALEPLRATWPGIEALGPRSARIVPWPHFAGLPPAALQALVEQDVAVVLPIAGPRGAWGHLFVVREPLAVAEASDAGAATAVTGQLALVFDAAHLLARAVAVERSLAHAEKLAAIGETAARIAHEIRNPITAARSLAQQLAREPATPFAAEHALILEELERVERQVRALLEFARRDELRTTPTDLGAVVRGALASFAPRLEADGVDVALDMPGAVVAPIDAEKMRQAVVNLVDNALDALATVPAPRRLAVSAGTRDGVATLTVHDNGPGVAPDALPRLFDPFWSGKPHGTGLGLAIVRRAVEAHGGRVEARSAPGAGTTFEVVLPIRSERA